MTDIRSEAAPPAAAARQAPEAAADGGGAVTPTAAGQPPARHRQSGVDEEGAEGTAGSDPRARRPPRRGGSPPQAGEPAQALHPAGAPNRHGPAALPRREVRYRHRLRRRATPATPSSPTTSPIAPIPKTFPAARMSATRQPRIRIALIDVATGDVKYVDHGQKITPPNTAGQRTETAHESGEPPVRPPAPQDRDVQSARSRSGREDGTKAVILARAADNKDRWILALDPATGKTRVLAQTMTTRGSAARAANTLGWMKNDREVYFQSERTGYAHLYAVAFDGGEPRALTSGKWEVINVRQSKDKSQVLPDRQRKNRPTTSTFTRCPATAARSPVLPPPPASTPPPSRPTTAGSPTSTRTPTSRRSYTCRRTGRRREQQASSPTSPAAEFCAISWQDAPIVTVHGARRRQGPGAPVQTRRTRAGRTGRRLRARRRLSAERRSQVVHLLPRVHVPPHPAGARLHRARRGLPRLRGLRPRLAHRHLPTHGRQGPRRHRRRREISASRSTASTRRRSASTAAVTAASSR